MRDKQVMCTLGKASTTLRNIRRFFTSASKRSINIIKIDRDITFEDPRYARGFVLSQDSISSPVYGWRHYRLRDLSIWADPRNPLQIGRSDTIEVAILGIACDIGKPDKYCATGISRLCHALTESRSAFYAALDTWAGRFIAIFNDGQTTRVCGDATCMRTLFFASSPPFLAASHASLVARMRSAPSNPTIEAIHAHPRWAGRRARYYPGSITPWLDVHFLTANVAIRVDTLQLERFWPRYRLPSLTVDESAELAIYWMKRQLVGFQQLEYPLLLSLTAGLDSRTTLAIARSNPAISSFTYIRPGQKNDMKDAKIASALAEAIQLPHHALHTNSDIDDDLRASLIENNFIPHKAIVADAYKLSFDASAIHIRSNIAEIGRIFWRKNRSRSASPLARDLASMWRRMEDCGAAVRLFQEWGDAVDFWDVTELDLTDLAYWEHRMPCWHGCVVLESDIAFDSVSLFNHRPTLVALLGAAVENRRRGDVFFRIIKKQAPELLGWPINGTRGPVGGEANDGNAPTAGQ